jgi:hypothetical protein
MAHDTIAFQLRLPKGDLDWLRERSTHNNRTVAQELRQMIQDKRRVAERV